MQAAQPGGTNSLRKAAPRDLASGDLLDGLLKQQLAQKQQVAVLWVHRLARAPHVPAPPPPHLSATHKPP